MPRDPARAVLTALDVLIGVAAVAGGLALATGLEADRFPPAWLASGPFDSYLGPGLILAVVVGGSALAAAAATLRDRQVGGRLSTVAGALLVGWIVGEVLIVTADHELVSPTEVVFLGLGIAMAILGIVLARTARRRAG